MIPATILTGAVVASLGSLVLDAASRVWRRDDPALWHVLWVALGVSSTVLAFLLVPVPHVVLTVPMTAAAPAALTSGTVPTVAAWIYAVGFVWQTARLLTGLSVVTRLAREARRFKDVGAARVGATAPDAAPLCRVHGRVRGPITVGWHRPLILLPEACAAWPMDRFRAILAHEYAHVRRGDYLWNGIAALHQAVYWWSPCAWWLARRVRLLAELASDREASDAIGPEHYAQHLIDAASEWAENGAIGILAPGATSNLVQRVEALASRASAGPAVGRAWRRTLAAMVVLVVTIGVSMRLESRSLAASPVDDLHQWAFPHLGNGSAHAAKHAAEHRPPSH